MSDEDFDNIKEILKDYYQHLTDNKNETLISKIYGIYEF